MKSKLKFLKRRKGVFPPPTSRKRKLRDSHLEQHEVRLAEQALVPVAHPPEDRAGGRPPGGGEEPDVAVPVRVGPAGRGGGAARLGLVVAEGREVVAAPAEAAAVQRGGLQEVLLNN